MKLVGLILKAIGIWLVLLVTAIGNAVFRDKWLVPAIGSGAALPVSGLLLALLILLAAFVSVPVFNSSEGIFYGLEFAGGKRGKEVQDLRDD